MYLKVHSSSKGSIVAVCDAGLIGSVLEEKGVQIDLDRYRSFYVGERADASAVKSALKKFTSANVIGEKSVKLAVSMGVVTQDDVMYIKNVPYTQVYAF